MEQFLNVIQSKWDQLGDSGPVWLSVLAASMLVCLLLWLFLGKVNNHTRAKRMLKKISVELLVDITLPDGMDNFVNYDFLLLTPDKLYVVDYKDFAGLLYGGEKTDQWAQVLERSSYKFENPLYQNQIRVMAVNALVPDVPVEGLVLFSDAGKFPRGRPSDVHLISTLLSEMPALAQDTPIAPALQHAWETIQRAGVATAPQATLNNIPAAD